MVTKNMAENKKENCENFDDGLTRVAPKGEFKAGKENEIEKEFNLSEARKKLFETELLGKITSAGRIYRKIRQQDKEFIRLCESRAVDLGDEPVVRLSDIKELAGDKLNGN